MKKLSNTGTGLKKALAYKKNVYLSGVYSLKEYTAIFQKRQNLISSIIAGTI